MRNTTNNHYTFERNAQAEQQLESTLRTLGREIAASGAAPAIRCVALGGGYGRGEGGVTADGRLYNDLDFFVFPAEGVKPGKLEPFFAELSHRFGKELGIEVDFFIAPSSGWLAANEATLMVQELLAGHRVVFGDDGVFSAARQLPWSEIPWSEGARLLLNRGAGLLLAAQRLRDPAELDFINRNIRKAELGCGDALLIANHAYCRTGTERLEALKRLEDGQALVVSYQRALEFKYRPGAPAAGNYGSELEMAVTIWKKTLKSFTGVINSREFPPSADPAAAAAMLPRCPGESPKRILKNILLGLLYYPQLRQLRPLTAHPRQKLLPLLVRAFRNSKHRDVFFRLWRNWS